MNDALTSQLLATVSVFRFLPHSSLRAVKCKVATRYIHHALTFILAFLNKLFYDVYLVMVCFYWTKVVMTEIHFCLAAFGYTARFSKGLNYFDKRERYIFIKKHIPSFRDSKQT